jgi:hypothetical protein
MTAKNTLTSPGLRAKAKRVLSAAGSALAEPLAMAAGFKDVEDFKASLIESLAGHPGFDKAARDLHGHHEELARLKLAKLASQISVLVRPSGRVQATRYDPAGQKDRSSGRRPKGGKSQ